MGVYKRLWYLFGLLLFICSITGCGQVESADELLSILEEEGEKFSEQIQTLTMEGLDSLAETEYDSLDEAGSVCYELPDHDTFAYDSLTEAEKVWYQDINRVLSYRSEAQIELSKEGIAAGLTQENVDKIYQCVLIDHPEYFYVDGYEYIKYSRLDKLVGIKIKACYTLDKQECEERKENIEQLVEAILNQAPMDGSDYEKIKYVYEHIIYQTEYDLAATDNQNIYSVFVGKASVCQGYAKATQYLLNRMGVPCTLVFGQVNGKEPHAWNMVNSDGEYYYVDTTWGDASYTVNGQIPTDKEAPGIKYDYLCINEKQLVLTHDIQHEVALPKCEAVNDNYYVKEGCYFQSYDEAQLQREIQEMLLTEPGMVTLKCETRDVYEFMYSELIEEQKIFSYLEGAHSRVAYLQEEEQLTLTFWVTK